jgi:5'-nucleotidase
MARHFILAKALQEIGDVFVVAPDSEKSAIAHSLTLHRPLRVEKIKKNFIPSMGLPLIVFSSGICVTMRINVSSTSGLLAENYARVIAAQ